MGTQTRETYFDCEGLNVFVENSLNTNGGCTLVDFI